MLSRTAAVLAAAVALTACTEDAESIGDPIAVESAVDSGRSGRPVLRVGAVIDQNSPSVDRDTRLLDRVREAAALVDGGHDLQLEVATIDEADDIPGALDLLTELGVTVLLTTCDTASVPLIAEASAERSLLTVTGCATLPHPDVPRSPLFADLANLDHVHEAMSTWARQEDFSAAATVSSDLLRDVAEVCGNFEDSFVRRGGSIISSTTFTGILDPVADVSIEVSAPATDADVLAVCALPGTIGPLITELRASGLDQPIVVPWFADNEDWGDLDDVHLVATASRHGDDPDQLVDEFVGDGASDDAIVLDTVATLTLAADATGSVGSQRLNDALLDVEFPAPSGPLEIDSDTRKTRGRTYRLIDIDDGEERFARSIVVN